MTLPRRFYIIYKLEDVKIKLIQLRAKHTAFYLTEFLTECKVWSASSLRVSAPILLLGEAR
jgi:hypothetical protein